MIQLAIFGVILILVIGGIKLLTLKKNPVCFYCGREGYNLKRILAPAYVGGYYYFHDKCLKDSIKNIAKATKDVLTTTDGILTAQENQANDKIVDDFQRDNIAKKYRERQWDSMMGR